MHKLPFQANFLKTEGFHSQFHQRLFCYVNRLHMFIPSASCRRRFPTWGMSWVRRRWPWGSREPGQHRWFVHGTDFSKSFQTVLWQNVFIIWYNVWWSGENRQKYRSKLGFLFIFDFDTLTLRKHKYSEFNQNDMEF